ncbi:similar to Saccharomyces cerevisiae YPR040W TIP41 Protein that interacts physically and genetically with Tap42p, which regulates protein phosphatase 2A [Maudiozyma saulgeensis]|uniref:Similar to Saccharomyces cerevisiae YPR040W TIP41 Protein that interacts physically and genetically with Tap42p, which regulates protein phosphatase 2A n=1 Tax=Maudiozyma saulgeensis TaxID=1789683 RepID=A0A1X7R5T6_9SACH|nr:similar to Saccharomyces cerevisiae YPR040W TIP41 Protein that interacts physically and genetically with Tap42p, which regulates protein phosphatase 2A [Kazachstania saulgeensis]
MSQRPDNKKFTRPEGINTIQIDAARQMHMRTVQARIPGGGTTTQSSTSQYKIPQNALNGGEPRTITTGRMFSAPSRSPPARHICNNPNNPPCANCGGVIIPSPKAFLPLEDRPSISINNWTISSKKRPILNAEELNNWETKELRGLGALPEMIFGNNFIRIMNTEHKWGIEFNTLDALKMVSLSDSGIRVAHSKVWLDSKLQQQQQDIMGDSSSIDMENSLKIVKNYDWTYSTEYEGTVVGDNKDTYSFKVDNNLKLPIDKLSKQDKILYFDEMVLFEDELADCGVSMLNVKIRVMNERLLLLCRFFLRVDDVLLRVYDTRVYVEFDDNVVMREIKKYEGNYNDILAKHHISHSHDPKAALRDSNWVAENTPIVDKRCEIMTFNDLKQ